MRNVHQRRNAGSPLTVHLEPNTGLWVEVRNGIMLRIESVSDGSVNVYLAAFGDKAFHIDRLLPDKINLSAEASS